MKIIQWLATLVVLISTLTATADVPGLVHYQGRLTDAYGSPVTGSKSFAIGIHDASTGGNLLYSETIGDVTLDANGIYRFAFGQSGDGLAAALGSSAEHWIEVTIDGTAQASRERILAVPFAVKAQEATSAKTSEDTQALIQALTASGVLLPKVESFAASPAVIIQGRSSTLSWSVSGATSVTIDHGIGAVSNTGSTQVTPAATTSYLLTASNAYGATTAQATITLMAVSPDMMPVQGGSLPASSWAGAQSVEVFAIGKTEVTWSEWQSVRGWAAANGYDIGGVGQGVGPNHPVTYVSFYDALKWCNARSEKEGLLPVYKVGGAVYRVGNSVPDVDGSAYGYRLPSEKEWEFAARGGVQSLGYEYSGSNDVNAVAWYVVTSGGEAKEVATKQANELGLHDMSGNVWEWCFDAGFDAAGSYRVFRGGSWGNGAIDCRAADRGDYGVPGSADDGVGFRVARSSVP